MKDINHLNKLSIECQTNPNIKRYIICNNLDEVKWYDNKIPTSDKYIIDYAVRGCDYEFIIGFNNGSELIFKLKNKKDVNINIKEITGCQNLKYPKLHL